MQAITLTTHRRLTSAPVGRDTDVVFTLRIEDCGGERYDEIELDLTTALRLRDILNAAMAGDRSFVGAISDAVAVDTIRTGFQPEPREDEPLYADDLGAGIPGSDF